MANDEDYGLSSGDEADIIAISPSKPIKKVDEEDFGLGSGDDEDIIALANTILSKPTKRRPSIDNGPPAKRVSVEYKKYYSATRALTEHFGMKEFRLKQEHVISRILGGGSAAVVFPTGGGKSLCFQIPALAFAVEDSTTGARDKGGYGITLVVSPLLALMKDQVDALVRRGIKAATMDSTKTREEYLHTSDMLRNGELKLLYCAPERLNNEGFIQQMKYVRGGIRLLAVDEAHCISEWGHAFRPDYLKISRFAREINAERVICLTATATPRVASDICRAFNIDESEGLFRTSTYRPNLQLLAESGQTKQKLFPRLFKFLRANPGPTVVYVTLQKQTEELAEDLRKQGFKAKAFHAGMAAAAKTELQDDFMKRNDLIIVATIAFGMGIDKPNIRNVVHFNIPSSLESYSQEIGRAGRDGKLSKCMFYICGEDVHLREMFARGDLPSRESIRGLLNEVFDQSNAKQPVGSELRVSLYNQAKDFDIRDTTLKNIYAQLELTYGILRETTPIYTKYTFKPGKAGGYDQAVAQDNSKAAQAIKVYAKKAKTIYSLDIDRASQAPGVSRPDIIRKLNELNQTQVIDLSTSGVLNSYKVLKPLPKAAAEKENLVKELFGIMEKREQEAMDRTEEMLRLITAKACYSRSLAQHFGDDLPNGKTECGHCTWCMDQKAVVQELPPPVPLNWKRFEDICSFITERDDARFLAKFAFGIRSPRMTVMKIGNNRLFASMDDHNFMDLLRAFVTICSKSNQTKK